MKRRSSLVVAAGLLASGCIVGTELGPEHVSAAPSSPHAEIEPVEASGPVAPARSAGEELPFRMGPGAVITRIDRLTPAVVDCGKAAGLQINDWLEIKFTVAGQTGAVVEARVVELEVDDTELAQCVNEAISALQADGSGVFSRFRDEHLQFNFRIR